MNRFSHARCYSQSGQDVLDFIADYFDSSRRTLFIGTLGIQPPSLFFPAEQFGTRSNIDFRIIVEKRREVSRALSELGQRHRDYISAKIPASSISFVDVDIVANDGATVGGRNAVVSASKWYAGTYTDIVVDATGMSRGVCFPLVRQALEFGLKHDVSVHLLVASNDEPTVELRSESNDRAEWMHGFQEAMGLDRTADILKLWVPQLSEGATHQTRAMFQQLGATSSVAEVCPIVPFPSKDARRGDKLLFEFEGEFFGDWDASHLNVIYAHESNPLDVFNSIVRMDKARHEVFSASTKQAKTVLSPCGWRIGSLGMLLAAIDRGLPMLYVETISYTTMSTLRGEVGVRTPDNLWHILLAGEPYDNIPLSTKA